MTIQANQSLTEFVNFAGYRPNFQHEGFRELTLVISDPKYITDKTFGSQIIS